MGKELSNTAQQMEFPIKDFFIKCNQILSFLQIWSHLLKKPLMENFIFLQCKKKNLSWKFQENIYKKTQFKFKNFSRRKFIHLNIFFLLVFPLLGLCKKVTTLTITTITWNQPLIS